MCMVLYLASDDHLLAIPWNENDPRFNVRSLAEWGWGQEVTKQFKRKIVYYVGSYQNCGCGFGDSSEQGLQCLRDLRDYLCAATAKCGIVEMWSCWTGAEGAERVEKIVIIPDDILDPGFRFGEQEYYLVCSDAERAAEADAQEDAITVSGRFRVA
jgi:hypothetical protein